MTLTTLYYNNKNTSLLSSSSCGLCGATQSVDPVSSPPLHHPIRRVTSSPPIYHLYYTTTHTANNNFVCVSPATKYGRDATVDGCWLVWSYDTRHTTIRNTEWFSTINIIKLKTIGTLVGTTNKAEASGRK